MPQPEPMRFLVAASLVLAIAGCASGGGGGGKRADEEPKGRSAADIQVQLGQGYLQKGQLETAQERLQRALRLDPKNVDAHTLLAVLNERINRPEIAERFYREAAELRPDGGAENNNYGAFLCGRERYAEADRYFQRALADPFYKRPGDAYGNAGACAAKAGDNDKALAYFRSALESSPNNAVALYEMARISYEKNDNLRARAFLQRLEAVAPAEPAILELAERIELRLGDKSAAKKYRDRLRQDFPDHEPVSTTEGSSSP